MVEPPSQASETQLPDPRLINPPAYVIPVNLAETSFALPAAAIIDRLFSRAEGAEYQPFDPKAQTIAYDGKIFGAGGVSYPAGTPIAEMRAVMPEDGKVVNSQSRTFFVNGIATTPGRALHETKLVAQKTHSATFCVYNATEGAGWDVCQVISDKFDLATNKAAVALATQMAQAVKEGFQIRIFADSHGTEIAVAALKMLPALLAGDGMSSDQVSRVMRDTLLETTGGVARVYPSEVQCIHWICNQDPAPWHLGVATSGLSDEELASRRKEIAAPPWVNPLLARMGLADLGSASSLLPIYPGDGAVIVRFNHKAYDNWTETHVIDTYLANYRTAEEILSENGRKLLTSVPTNPAR